MQSILTGQLLVVVHGSDRVLYFTLHTLSILQVHTDCYYTPWHECLPHHEYNWRCIGIAVLMRVEFGELK
jgi:hypothetical protein